MHEHDAESDIGGEAQGEHGAGERLQSECCNSELPDSKGAEPLGRADHEPRKPRRTQHHQANSGQESRNLHKPAKNIVLWASGWCARNFERFNRCDDQHNEDDAEEPSTLLDTEPGQNHAARPLFFFERAFLDFFAVLVEV